MQMCDTCQTISGLLVAAAGLVFVLFGFGSTFNGMSAHQVAGALLFLFGLSLLFHSAGMCSMCKAGMPKGRK